jgi:TM2 domain-containing membrane protein YozV
MNSGMNHYKSKTFATWLAFLGGGLGLHRFYLFGPRDAWGWLWPLPTAIGVYGAWRGATLGQDDQLAWLLVPLLGVSLAAGMLAAIVYGLMPDEKWNARFNPEGRQHVAGWSTVIGVVLSLFIGATVLMATLAFGSQRYFEYQIEEAHKISR